MVSKFLFGNPLLDGIKLLSSFLLSMQLKTALSLCHYDDPNTYTDPLDLKGEY